jgi:hypothetical protein
VRVAAENAARIDVVAKWARDINMQVSFDEISVVNNRHNSTEHQSRRRHLPGSAPSWRGGARQQRF